MHLNFGYAKKNGGVCYLRFDDTNPEKVYLSSSLPATPLLLFLQEDMEYFNSIIDNVKWMGWEPWKITYSSHYFPKLYELAVELIKRDKVLFLFYHLHLLIPPDSSSLLHVHTVTILL